jgi:plastocyanin
VNVLGCRLTPLRRAGARALAAAALALGAGGAAQAGEVEVRVVDAAGRPLPDAVVFLESASAQSAARPMPLVEVSQVQRQFDPQVTVVTVGTAVSFPNRDTVRHHVYSFSPTKRFEIKLYVGTPAEPVVFDRPGIAVLGCNIHDQMVAWVVVVPTPWHGKTDARGVWRAPAVPPGAYRLRTWHSALPVGDPASDDAITVDARPARHDVTLARARP